MSKAIYTVYVSFFSDKNCKNILNTTIVDIYDYSCNRDNCYGCNYIEEDHRLVFNSCHNNQTWFCIKEVEEDKTIESIIMWITFLGICCCILWCCWK